MVDIIGGHRIVDAVAEASGVSRGALTGRKRAATVAVPRHLAMYLMHELSPHLSTSDIAGILRRHDHTTVLYGVRRWRNHHRQTPAHRALEQRARAILDCGAARQDTEAVAGSVPPPPRAQGIGRLPFASAVTASVTLSGVRPCAPERAHSGAVSARHERLPPQPDPAAGKTGDPQPAAGAFSQGRNASAGKAKGGRKVAQTARNYYATFGGRRGDHERARKAADTRKPGTCMACDSAGQIDGSGLCTDCADRVQRVAPAAAYGGERGNLSRASGGTEADNIVTSD